MQSRGSYGFKNNLNASWIVYIMYMHLLHIYGVYKRSSKKGNYRRRSRVERGSGSLELSKYTSQRTTFQDFRCYQGVTLYAYFKIFRPPPPFARLLSHLTRMKVHVLWSVTTVQRFCRLPWKFQGCASFMYFLHKLHLFVKTPTYIPIHPNLNESVKVRKFLGGSLWWSKICIVLSNILL